MCLCMFHLRALAVIYRTVKRCMKAEVIGRDPGQTDAAVYNKELNLKNFLHIICDFFLSHITRVSVIFCFLFFQCNCGVFPTHHYEY